MFSDMKPSHLLLLFLTGALALLVLGPLVLVILSGGEVGEGTFLSVYRSAYRGIGEAGIGGSIAGLGLLFALGLLMDALNVLSHRKRIFSSLKRLIARLWGYGGKIDYMESHPGFRSQRPRIDPDDDRYPRYMLWRKTRKEVGHARGWEWFLSHAFTITVLEVGLLFWLVIAAALAHWVNTRGIPSDAPYWILGAALGYVLLVPAEVHHRYARVKLENEVRRAFENGEGRGPENLP